MNERNQLRRTHIFSAPVVLMTIIQFVILFGSKFIIGQDSIGLITTIFQPLIYISTFFLILSVVTVLNNKSAGLFDLLLVTITVIVTYYLIS
jgi:hypothetical protein